MADKVEERDHALCGNLPRNAPRRTSDAAKRRKGLFAGLFFDPGSL